MVCRSETLVVGVPNVPWSDWAGTYSYTIETLFEPKSLLELVDVVAQATAEGKELRALGSGWAYGDIATSADWVVSMASLKSEMFEVIPDALHDTWLARQYDAKYPERLIHVQAGITIAELNALLDRHQLAMISLGGANGQSLAGAIATSTHGGDVALPPLPDLVQAIHLVTDGGREIWIERASDPITSDTLAPILCPDARIVRDDAIFNAVLVSAGRFGVVFAFVLRVRGRYRLAEWSVRLKQEIVFGHLRTGLLEGRGLQPLFEALDQDDELKPPAALGADLTQPPRFLEILFNSQDPTACFVRRRWPTTTPDDLNLEEDENPLCDPAIIKLLLDAAAGALMNFAAVVIGIPFWGLVLHSKAISFAAALRLTATRSDVTGGEAMALALNALWEVNHWSYIPKINDIALVNEFKKATTEGRRGPGFRIMTGSPESNQQNCYRGDSSEIIFPANTDAYINFLNELLPIGPRHRQAGYVSLRYSAPSKALLSMHNFDAPEVVSIEVSTISGLEENQKWLDLVNRMAVRGGGRPHWGQINWLQVSEIAQLYGASLIEWREALLAVSGTSTTFSNAYTRRRGLEPVEIAREVVASSKDEKGRITHLCGGPAAAWSPVSVQQAKEEIRSGVVNYFTRVDDMVAKVVIVGDHLQTTADPSSRNNLDNLPDC